MGTFPEKYGRAGTEHPDFEILIMKMGTDAPIPPRAARSAASDVKQSFI
jgi:hypothetical protein